MSFVSEGVAVVTGAGSGIGRALAQQLSAAGSALAIADINEKALDETAAALKGKAAASKHVLDISNEEAVRDLAADVTSRHGRATLLINNAGVALIGNFEEISLDDLRWLMNINFWGVVYGVKYFLPILKQQPRAQIVNLSSVFGIIGPVGQSAYSASKFAVRGFTEVLRHELEGTSVFVSCVHPGGIHTPIARSARLGANTSAQRKQDAVDFFDKVTPTSPEAAAARILKGVEKKEPRILIGRDARQIDIVQRLRPGSYWKVMAKKAAEPSALKR
ncbi:MAG TPA: SDR family NAD(P)-dependent oxidoreductase [Candidatus Methylomirabilis sp.]|nr:SDR family NAD(P)-dependent oxidoreductase [Candidatus Methylomirabilis sp.]